jgi:flagellar biosynthesis/type III secretory pathway chaperone
MKQLLDNLIESLREELKEYGELLALLDQQQQLVITRRAPELLRSVEAVDAQAVVIHSTRQEREQRRLHLARTLGLSDNTSFKELIERLPLDYRPLLGALVDENNELLGRAQQRARQNHLLLSRAVDLMQRLVVNLQTCGVPSAYNHCGCKPELVAAEPQVYNAVG